MYHKFVQGLVSSFRSPNMRHLSVSWVYPTAWMKIGEYKNINVRAMPSYSDRLTLNMLSCIPI